MGDVDASLVAAADADPASYRRETGEDLGRLLAISDGVFAFAMTLLVLGLLPPVGGLPNGVGPFLNATEFQNNLVAYALGFFVTGIYWMAHNRIFTFIHRYDRTLLQLNLVVLIFVVLVPLGVALLEDGGRSWEGVVSFATMQAGTGLAMLGLWAYASGAGHLTSPHLPPAWKRYLTFRVGLPPLIFLASIPLAFVRIPLGTVSIPVAEFSWALVFVISPLRFRAIRDRFFPGVVDR